MTQIGNRSALGNSRLIKAVHRIPVMGFQVAAFDHAHGQTRLVDLPPLPPDLFSTFGSEAGQVVFEIVIAVIGPVELVAGAFQKPRLFKGLGV